MSLNKLAAKRHALAARRGRPAPPTPTAEDGLQLISHGAAIAEHYRTSFLPSTLGLLLQRVLENSDNRHHKAARTGDLSHLVEMR